MQLPLAEGVPIKRNRGGTAYWSNVARCGLVWECPDCSAAVKAARADELRRVLAWYRSAYHADGVSMLTLTVAHGFGDDVGRLRRGVAHAFRLFQGSREWAVWKRAVGFVGSVRALEVTFGVAGAHPHLHVLFFTRAPLGEDFAARAYVRWRDCVVRVLGEMHAPREFAPDGKRLGAHLMRCRDDGSYLAKLGLEVSSPSTKRAKGDNCTPYDLLAQSAANPDDTAPLHTFRAYVDGMKGARQLTWSRYRGVGLRELARRAGVVGEERTDEEIAAGEGQPEDETIVILTRDEHKELQRTPGACVTALEIAQTNGAAGVLEFLAALVELDGAGSRRRFVDRLRERARILAGWGE